MYKHDDLPLGEGPLYDPTSSTLLYFDCVREPWKAHELHIIPINANTGEVSGDFRAVSLKESVTVAALRRSAPGSLICAHYSGVSFLDIESGNLKVLKEVIPKEDKSKLRFNDGAADAAGRFYFIQIDLVARSYGRCKLPESYGRPKGKLYRYDPDGSLHDMEAAGGFITGNGICWSPDNSKSMIFDLYLSFAKINCSVCDRFWLVSSLCVRL